MTCSVSVQVVEEVGASAQVSNWFANARRRLKNTVRQPDLSWALRIKLYNKYIQGNAERLSVCSDDTDSDGRLLLAPQIRELAWVSLRTRLDLLLSRLH